MEQDIEDTYDMLLDHKVPARLFFKNKRYHNLIVYLLGYLTEEDIIELMFINRQVHGICVAMKELKQIISIKNIFIPKLLENGFENIIVDPSSNNVLLELKTKFKIMKSFQAMIKQFFNRWINLHWFIKGGRKEVSLESLTIVYKSLLFGVFKMSREIEKIHISNCHVDSYDFNDLLDNIKELPLTYLSLPNNKIFSQRNIENFYSTMKCQSRLKHLNLSSCELDDELMKEIGQSFSYLISLEELDLNSNTFTFKSLDVLIHSLRKLPNLTSLNLERIKLSTAGCATFADYLTSMECNLKILKISSSNMGNNGLKLILKALKENCKLDTIILKNIDTNEEGFALLTKSIPELNIKNICYNDNIISENVYHKLRKIIVGSKVKSLSIVTKKNNGIVFVPYRFEDHCIKV
jgi:hypothetical protein